jgi:hypothetical protein
MQRPARRRRLWWPLIADDLFRVAHDDYGKPRLHRDVARLGLAAAVLAELLLTETVTIDDDKLISTSAVDPTDSLAAAVLRQVHAERHDLPVRDWLAFLGAATLPGGDMYEQVAGRLTRAGHVRPAVRRFPRRVRYVPLDINAAAWPWARLSQSLGRGEQLNDFNTVLGGLILATDLHRRVLTGDAGGIEQRVRLNTDRVPTPVQRLLYHTETATGATVITGA